MSELHHTLETMGVLQFLFAAVFLMCYALAIGDFLGPGARTSVAVAGLSAAVGFSFFTQPWVHGVLLTTFAVIGIGLFLGLAWLLKILLASAVGEVSLEAAYDDAVSATAEYDDAEPEALPPRAAPDFPAPGPVPEASLGRLLGAEPPSLDQRPS